MIANITFTPTVTCGCWCANYTTTIDVIPWWPVLLLAAIAIGIVCALPFVMLTRDS